MHKLCKLAHLHIHKHAKICKFYAKKWTLLAFNFNLDHSNLHNPLFLSQSYRKSPEENFGVQHDWLTALKKKSRDFKAIEYNH